MPDPPPVTTAVVCDVRSCERLFVLCILVRTDLSPHVEEIRYGEVWATYWSRECTLKAVSYLTWVRGGTIKKGSSDGIRGACLA